MKNEKKDFITFLNKNINAYKKYQNEITKEKSQNNIKFQEEFIKGLNHYENCLKNPNKQTIKENKEKILKFIIMCLLAEKANKTVETSIDGLELIAANNYYDKEMIEKYINNITNNFSIVSNNYSGNVTLIVKIINIIKVFLESESFDLKNGSFYDIISFLLINIIQKNSSDNKTSTYQIRKLSKSMFNKCIDFLIEKSCKINFDLDNIYINYYIKCDLDESLFDKYIKQIFLYSLDNYLEKLDENNKNIDNNNNKNEKNIEKGKYNWCFICRNEANYLSEDLLLPICSKKCENIIKIKEKSLNLRIIKYNTKYTIFDDYLNTIKVITYNVFFYLKILYYHNNDDDNIIKDLQKVLPLIEEKLNFFTEIILNMLSQPIIKDTENNNHIFDLIKEYVFPFLFEISYFYRRINNINGLPNVMKIFEFLMNELDDKYINDLKMEIYTFTEKVIFPYFSTNIYNLDFIKSENSLYDQLILKEYMIKLLSSDLKNLLFELHTNYDCDFYFNNFYTDIVKEITNITYENIEKKNKNESEENLEINNKIEESSLNFVKVLVKFIAQFAIELNSKKNDGNDEENNNDKAKSSDYINYKNIFDQAIDLFNIDPLSTINFFIKKKIIPQEKDFIKYKEKYIRNNMNNAENENNDYNNNDLNKNKRYKYNLTYFPIIFENEDYIKDENNIENIFNSFFNINFSISLNYDDFSAYILAYFIKYKFTDIMENNKLNIANYFSTFSSFSLKALSYYINSFNFKNYTILEGLHLIFYYLPYINNYQLIEKIINFFSIKFTKDNFNTNDLNFINNINEFFIKLSIMVIDISMSNMKNIGVKKETLNRKLKPINEYITNFKKNLDYLQNIEKYNLINNNFIYRIYNLTLTNPIVFNSYQSRDSLVDSNGLIKSNNDLYGKFPSDLYKIEILKKASNDNKYIVKRNMSKQNLCNIINSTWDFILGIFSKYITYYNDKELIVQGIDNILLMGKICGMMKLYTISDVFINSIVNMIGLYDSYYQKLYYRNLLALKILISFIHESGEYIYTSWHSILRILSRINQLKNCPSNLLYNLCNNKKIDKKTFNDGYAYNYSQLGIIDIEKIYTLTSKYSIETLKQFVLDLTKVVEEELLLFKDGESRKNKERFFSFNKLVYVIDVNRERWKNKDHMETYEIVQAFFVKLISENPLDDILLNKIKDSFKMIDHSKE